MPSDGGYRTVEGNSRKRQKISRPRPTDSASPSASNSHPHDATSKSAATDDKPIVITDLTSGTTPAPSTAMSLPTTINGVDASVSAPLAGCSSTTSTTAAAKAPCPHERSLAGLQTDISAMRDLITCKVCLEFLYEPYAFACGHTFCYTCISSWMEQKKTCPDCRDRIRQEPTPSYLIREMVMIFLGRPEWLLRGTEGEDGEESREAAVEKLRELARTEAEAVAADKANADPVRGGLFKGFFRRRAARKIAMFDYADHVYRCPDCHHEVENGWCVTCEAMVEEGSDDEDMDMGLSGGEDGDDDEIDEDDESLLSDELDHDLDTEDADAEQEAMVGGLGARAFFEEADYAGYSGSSDDEDHPDYPRVGDEGPLAWHFDGEEEEEGDDENDPEMDSFVVNDDEIEYEEDASHLDQDPSSRISISSDDEEDAVVSASAPRRRGRPARAPRHITIDSDDDDDDDDSDEGDTGNALHHVPRPQLISSDDDDDESSSSSSSDGDDTTTTTTNDRDDDDDEGDNSSQSGVPSSATAGDFSPLQDSMDERSHDDDEDDADEDDGDDIHRSMESSSHMHYYDSEGSSIDSDSTARMGPD